MKQYHTEIDIAAPPERVWRELVDFERYPSWNPLVGRLDGQFTTGGRIRIVIKPLNRRFTATMKTVEPNVELTWIGVRFAAWVISGEHYYRLEPLGANDTRLRHGEVFRGLASAFLGAATLRKMEDAFNRHNSILKARVENA
jgi:hypothetical protein